MNSKNKTITVNDEIFLYLIFLRRKSNIRYEHSVISLLLFEFQHSWWIVKLTKKTNIYMVKVTPSPNQNNYTKTLITTSLQESGSSPICKKEMYIGDLRTIVICEPPLPGRYVRIETKNGGLMLCEVEVFGSGKPDIIYKMFIFKECIRTNLIRKRRLTTIATDVNGLNCE